MIRADPPRYRAYLLRCWEVRSPHPSHLPAWRFSLEDSHTGEKHGFTDMEALNTFLRAELAQAEPLQGDSDLHL